MISEYLSCKPELRRSNRHLGPSIGGLLAHPSDHFKAFQGEYWKANPYALPCYTSVVLGIITMLVLMFGLSEVSLTPSSHEHRLNMLSDTAIEARLGPQT